MCPAEKDSHSQNGKVIVRPRLLDRFGHLIINKQSEDHNSARCSSRKQRARTVRSLESVCISEQPTSVTYFEPLNSYDGVLRCGLPRSNTEENKKQVRFFEKAAVVEIPNRRDFGPERKKIWSSLREIKVNAKRNREEFHADGCDWRKCKEEDEMVFQCGKLMHPATYRHKVHSSQRVKPQKKVIRASRVLTKYTLQRLLAERVNQPRVKAPRSSA